MINDQSTMLLSSTIRDRMKLCKEREEGSVRDVRREWLPPCGKLETDTEARREDSGRDED
jgi:hypothetical protein